MTAAAHVASAGPVAPLPRRLQLPFPHPGTGRSQSCPIPRDGIMLGRGATVFDLAFGDPAMSPRHAEVQLQGEQATVSDLGGGGGTRVNGRTISEVRALVEGDVLRLGDTIMIYTRGGRPGSAQEGGTAAEPELSGTSESIEAVRRSVEAVAPHSRTVVVAGETGTGKEIVARLLHRRSGRAGPMLAVNCGGFSEGLLASELFGHVRGAFTGAVTDQPGLFRAAQGGTLLLDEVGDIPLALQPVLLRVLETRVVRPVGSTRDVPVDVRVVAASNHDLVALVQQGLFRADLYARLAQWVVRLSPLRDRRSDIPSIARSLLARLGAADRTMTADLEEALLVHPWPLNVRGLLNVLSVADIATPAGQPLGLLPETLGALHDNRLEAAEAPVVAPEVNLDRAALDSLLRRFRGRVAEMARHLGVSRPRLYRLIWAAALEPAQYRTA